MQDVELPSVFEEMLDETAGYIRISQFTGVTPKQYEEAFASLEEQGMQQLVIDLRNNPAGFLRRCVTSCGTFFRKELSCIQKINTATARKKPVMAKILWKFRWLCW